MLYPKTHTYLYVISQNAFKQIVCSRTHQIFFTGKDNFCVCSAQTHLANFFGARPQDMTTLNVEYEFWILYVPLMKVGFQNLELFVQLLNI